MPITVEATFENGVLRPHTLLPLAEQETVMITVQSAPAEISVSADEVVLRSAGLIKCNDPHVVEHFAMDKGLEYYEATEDE